MKKLMIALLATGYCYGMDIQTKSSSQLGNSLLAQVEDASDNRSANIGSSENLELSSVPGIIDNSQSLTTEWKVWDIMSRVLSPVQILVTSANAFIGGIASSMANNNPHTTQKLVIASTVLSGSSILLEVLLSKMESRNRTIGQTLTGSTSQTTTPSEVL